MDTGLHILARSIRQEELSELEKTKQLKDIGKHLKEWLPLGGYVSYRAYREYVNSGYKTLPYSGGYLEQPSWVQKDFELFGLVVDFYILNDRLRENDR